MQRLGKVINVTPSRNVIVKIAEPPKMSSAVVDEGLNAVGRVFDIIGPVASPYAVVKPTIKAPEKLVNKQLYLLLSKRERSKRA